MENLHPVTEIEDIIRSIKDALESDGIYSPTFDIAIRNLAQTVYLKDSAFSDAVGYKYPDIDEENANKKGSSIVIERSREGFLRYKANPAYGLFLDYAEKVAKLADSLRMTVKSSVSAQDDELDDLKKKVEDAMSGVKS